MAQHFEIPISFEFQCARIPWRATTFSIAGRESEMWRRDVVPVFPAIQTTLLTGPSDALVIRLDEGGGIYAGPNETAVYSASSDDLADCFEKLKRRLETGEPVPESMSTLLICPKDDLKPGRKGDAWKMREEFLRMEESTAALLAFLQRWGTWGYGQSLYSSSVLASTRLYRLGESLTCVLPFLIWEQRKELRRGMLSSPDAWLSEKAALGTTHRRPRFPFIGITANNCFRAIETTITIDHLRNVKSRVCERADCDNIFTVESNHGKTYCGQPCAHLASVRRARAAKKAAISATGKGK